jgi:transposase-like protein
MPENRYGSMKCPYCKSRDVVKAGKRKNTTFRKQMYQCNKCMRRFTLNDGFLRMRHSPRVISMAINMYAKSSSLSQIKDHLYQFENVKVSRTTILNWVNKYTAMIKAFVDKLPIDIKGAVHVDEVFLKCSKETHYFWNSIDAETKMILATVWSEFRTEAQAKILFYHLKHKYRGRPPKIVTDGLWEYISAFNKYFRHISKHVRAVGFKEKRLNNQAERLQNEVKQRYKTMRTFKAPRSAGSFLELFAIHHNFARPHMSLNGRTPAEAAECEAAGKLGRNKVESLIRLLCF